MHGVYEHPSRVKQSRKIQDRRTKNIDLSRRKFDRRNRAFFYFRSIHLGDTNSFGNVYYARFFDIFGEAREEYLLFILGNLFNSFFNNDLSIVTVEATCKYCSSLFVYDRIAVILQVPALKRTKFKMTFRIIRESDYQTNPFGCKPLALGEQWIGFTTRAGKPLPIPDVFASNLRNRKLILDP